MKYLFAAVCLLFAAATITSLYFYNQCKRAHKQIKTIPLNANLLKKKLAEDPPAWMVKQIQSDLGVYATGIPKEMLDRAFSGRRIQDFSLVRFTIKEGHIAFAHDEKNLYSRHFRELFGCIKKLNEFIPLPDVDFIVSLEDGFESNPGLGPCFVFAKRADIASLILIPDTKTMVGSSRLRNQIPTANDKFPWDKKVGRSFWRGSSTGGYSTLHTWESLARAKLVLLSLNHPDEIDARFTGVVQSDGQVPVLMKVKGMLSKSVAKADHLRYKYLIDIDGNSCSCERYFWLLLSNSLVLKQVTPNIQWYYGALEPYKHYVPVKEDLSDLLEKIEWAKEHDLEAKLIAEEATHFVENNLQPEDTALYLYLLIQEYAKLQTKSEGVSSI